MYSQSTTLDAITDKMSSDATTAALAPSSKAHLYVKSNEYIPVALSNDAVHDDSMCSQQKRKRDALQYAMSCPKDVEESDNTFEEPATPAKGRLCVQCKDYFPLACFISEDRTDNPTVCNNHVPNKRYCRGCGDFVKLDLFSRGPTRQFACRKHMNLYGGVKQSKKKQMENPETKRRTQQWRRCYEDSRRLRHAPPSMSQVDIEREIQKVDSKSTGNYAVMPVDIKIATSPQNVTVVTLQQRLDLMKLVDSGDLDACTRVLAAIQNSYA